MSIRFSQSRFVAFVKFSIEAFFFLLLVCLLALPAIKWLIGRIPAPLTEELLLKIAVITALFGTLHLVLHRFRLRDMVQRRSVVPSRNPFKRAHFLLLIPIFIVSAAIYSDKVGDFDLVNDEYQVFSTAYGYLQSGQFLLFDFCSGDYSGERYTRAFPHTWLVAQSFGLFGVSEWAARIVSVLFGALFSVVCYLISYSFTRSRLTAVLVSLACILHPSLTVIFRLTRMYSVLMPSFLVTYFAIHHTLSCMVEPNRSRRTLLFLALLAMILCAFSLLIHINSAVFFPFLLFYVLYLAAVERKVGYIVLSILGIGGIGLVAALWLFTSHLAPIANHLGPPANVHLQYFRDLLQTPFKLPFGLAAYLLAFPLVFLLRRTFFQRNIVSLLILNLTGVLFFVYLAKRYYAFKYMSFLVPTSALLILLVSFLILRTFRYRWMQVLLVSLGCANLVDSRSDPVLYEAQRPNFREAYAVIKESFDIERGELLVHQYLRCYYMRESLPDMRQFNLGRKQQVEYDSFVRAISDAPSGWVVWNVKKEDHVKRKIWRLVRTCFSRQNETTNQWNGVEVYRFDQNQPCLITRRKMPSHIKKATKENRQFVEMSQPFSISFWVRSKHSNPGGPLALGGELKNGLVIDTSEEEGIRFRYYDGDTCGAIATGPIFDGDWHHVVLYQEGGYVGLKYGVYVDGALTNECPVRTPKDERARFLVNNFQGDIQNVRLFEEKLGADQVQALIAAGPADLTPELTDESGVPFSPVVLWTSSQNAP